MNISDLTDGALASFVENKMQASLSNMKEVGYLYFEVSNVSAILKTFNKEELDTLIDRLKADIKGYQGRLFREDDAFFVDPASPYRFVLFLFSPPRHKDSFTETDLKLVSTRILYRFDLFLQEECGYREIAEHVQFDGGYVALRNDYKFRFDFLLYIAYKHASYLSRQRKVIASLLSNVSHELRTPLTCIKGYAESLLEGAMENKELCGKFITIISEETQRLERLINNLLDISTIDSRQVQMKTQETDLCELIKSVCDIMKPVAVRTGFKLVMNLCEPSVIAEVDEDRIKQLLIILIDNSLKYADADTSILVSLEKAAGFYILSVEDHGRGISCGEMDKVFERFYRCNGDTPQKKGCGLGLSLAKFIAEAHGGSIEIDKNYRDGCRVVVKIPIEEF